MSSKFLYLVLDLAVISVPFAASFYPKAPFYKQWKYSLPGLLITAALFIVWDELFTRLGIWNFNERYITGIYIGSLPIEEVLFFICIPYACLFTYFALKHLIKYDVLSDYHNLISTALCVILALAGVALFDKLYTAVTFVSLAALLFVLKLTLRTEYIGRFFIAYLLLLVPFFIVNGILTGAFTEEPVVRYDDSYNLGVRLGTIPVEDMFYGMLMMLLPVSIAEYLEGWVKRQAR